jgi:hypothetical protein
MIVAMGRMEEGMGQEECRIRECMVRREWYSQIRRERETSRRSGIFLKFIIIVRSKCRTRHLHRGDQLELCVFVKQMK